MKVSVILPVYNGEKTLRRTLESLVHQSFKDFELIVCIDGSKDDSILIINEFKECFKHLKLLINKKNLGLGATMNKLVAHSIGEYIAVAEQDDFYYEYRLEKQVDFLNKNSDYGIVTGIADFWDGEKVTFRFPGILVNGNQYPKGEEMFLYMYRFQTKVVNSCMMFRKKVHIENGLYFSKHYPNIPVDWAYFLRFCLVSDIYGLQETLVLLDRRVDRASVTSNKKVQFEAAKELLKNFKYEYPRLITIADYKFARTTQHIMELSECNKYRVLLYLIKYFLQNPRDKRWLSYIKKRIVNFIK